MRNVTIKFDDGTSHVYNGVPDDVTPEQVTARAKTEFPDNSVTNIDGGYQETTTKEKISNTVNDVYFC